MMSSTQTASSYSIIDAIKKASSYLASHQIKSPRLHAELLLGHIVKCSRIDLYMKFDQPLVSTELEAYRILLKRHSEGEPVQYIIGATEFYSLPFEVAPAVLIPRPETEILVELADDYLSSLTHEPAEVTGETCDGQLDLIESSMKIKKKVGGNVLDIGVGSGVIALTLAYLNPWISVIGTEISPEAVIIAKRNRESLELTDRVQFLEGTCCTPLQGRGFEDSFDLIVSNPPYIRTTEISNLPEEIKKFEPILALDGGDDGLKWYRQIAMESRSYLAIGARLMVEIGANQANGVTEILKAEGVFTDITVKKDYNGLDRVISAKRSQ